MTVCFREPELFATPQLDTLRLALWEGGQRIQNNYKSVGVHVYVTANVVAVLMWMKAKANGN